MNQKTILKTWMIKGTLETLSPMVIGTGKKQGDVDIMIIRDETGSPFIPATSMCGALRSYWGVEQDGFFWGESKGEIGIQSALILRDAYLEENPNEENAHRVEVRDGVKINNKRGIARDKGKYDYETLASGAKFSFHMEVNLWEGDPERRVRSLLHAILRSLINGEIRVGAMSTKGFGQIRLNNPKGHEFDFSKHQDLICWLEDPQAHLSDWKGFSADSIAPVSRACGEELVVEAWFSLKTSMLIRQYEEKASSESKEGPDAIHIQSNGKPILPGTSVKGALRARAERILHTLTSNTSHADQLLHSLMGNVDEGTKERIKSRMRVEETSITQESIIERIHSRVKIDRFTGGTMETALFNFKPIWPKNGEKTVHLKCTIQGPSDWEAGLLMLLLKDLWTGDLPVGGEKSIGRGVLQGITAKLDYKNTQYTLQQEKDGLSLRSEPSQSNTIETMEGWLTCLHEELQKKEAS